MKKYIYLWVFIALLFAGYFLNRFKPQLNNMPDQISPLPNPISLEVGTVQTSQKPETITQIWEGNKLKISVVHTTQSCGGLTWTAGYTLDKDTLTIMARGIGPAMNCPAMNVDFNFSISDLPKKDYKIVPDISIIFN